VRKKIALAALGTLAAVVVAAVVIVLHAHAEYRYCLTFYTGPQGFLGGFHTTDNPASYSCSFHEWWHGEFGQ
jgi:hypothetical protein